MSNEKKYTQEEIKAIVEEELRKANLAAGRELNMDEMANVSGGSVTDGITYVLPKTHEEIDMKWDVIQAIVEEYGKDVAYIAACDLQVLAGGRSLFDEYGTGVLRQRMHDNLDGKVDLSGLDAFTKH
jgi:hypothetical protein